MPMPSPVKMMLAFVVLLNLAMVTACLETTTCPPKDEPKPPKPVTAKPDERPPPNDEPYIECVQRPVDVALVIDSTTSIGSEANFTLGLDFLRDFLQKFDISPTSTRVAAVMFGEGVYTESVIPFGKYTSKQETLKAISGLKWRHGQRTETAQGINYMVDNFLPQMRPNVDRVGIVLTDGRSHDSVATKLAAERARGKKFTMIAIGVGRPPNFPEENVNGILDIQELNNIAGREDSVLIVGQYSKLKSITDKLVEKFCHGII